jgi:hypothetical protein
MLKEEMIVDVITKSGNRPIDITAPAIESLINQAMKKPKDYLEKVYDEYTNDTNNFAYYVALMCM